MTDDTNKMTLLLDDLIEALHKRVKSGDATPADLNVARQLLKDNNVGFTKKNKAVKALVHDLPFDPNADFDEARPN